MAKINTMLLIVVLSVAFASTAWAGTGYKIRCLNPQCDFASSIGLGGGMRFEEITGYCFEKNSFVRITWPRQGKYNPDVQDDRAPKPMTIWNHATGESFQVYTFPDCSEPLLPITNIKEFKFCPQCNQPTLEFEAELHYD